MAERKFRCLSRLAALAAGLAVAAAATAAPTTASPTGSAAASTAVPPAAAPWKLGLDGYGPLKFGMDFDAARRAGARGIRPTPPPEGNPQCDQMLLPGRPGVSLMFVDGVLRRVDIYRADRRTTLGVAPGDPVRKLRQAYPALREEAHKYDRNGQYLTLGPDHDIGMRFEIQGTKVSRIYAGRWQEVQLVEGCF